jgi:hypothetical protein
MECKVCNARATWRIHTESKEFRTAGRGGLQRNVYACDNHKEQVRQQVETENKDDLMAVGNPFATPDPVVASPA